MNFTARLREELAHAPVGPTCCRTAETAAVVRLGGALHLSDAGTGWIITLIDGAVVRRLHSAVVSLTDLRPRVEVHRPSGLRGTRYRLHLPRPVEPLLTTLGVLDSDGRPSDDVSRSLTSAPHDAAAFLRGALMAAGSISDPRRPPHLELRVPGPGVASAVRRLLSRCGASGAKAAQRDDGWRVFAKSGAEIGAVLARSGAHGAFLTWDGERLRRELRGEANRAANADQANLGRAVSAASRQVTAIESAVGVLGWDAIPDQLRTTALARLANPQATLAELGALHTPPVGKATVHRRLARLADLAHEATEKPAGDPG